MLVQVRFAYEFGEELKVLWGESLASRTQQLEQGFGNGFNSLRFQIGAVLRREGAALADIAFGIRVDRDRFSTEIYAYPITVHKYPDLFFRLTKAGKEPKVPFEFHRLLRVEKDTNICVQRVEHFGIDPAWRLSSDFAREGLSDEMKKACAEFGKFMRAATLFHNMGEWTNAE